MRTLFSFVAAYIKQELLADGCRKGVGCNAEFSPFMQPVTSEKLLDPSSIRVSAVAWKGLRTQQYRHGRTPRNMGPENAFEVL